MKKLLLTFFVFITCAQFAQKSKTTTTAKQNILATSANISAQIITENKQQKLVLIIDKNGKTENVLLKNITTKETNQLPTNFKITPLTIAGIKLHHISYSENLLSETKLKKENTTINTNLIFEIADTNNKIFENEQKIFTISEIKYLDKGKNASHTVDSIKREGYLFNLTKDNKITLSTKSTSATYVFNAKNKNFEQKK